MDEEKPDSSFAGFGVTLGTNIVYCILILFVFCYFRTSDRNIYEPKTYMTPEDKRPERPPPGLFGWIPVTWKTSDEVLLKVAGLDAFMFIKFLRTAMYFFLVITIVTFAVLLPLNILDQKDNLEESKELLDIGMKLFTMAGTDKNHYQWAHVACTIFVSVGVIVLLFHSVKEYADLRHKCLLEYDHRISVKARTLLVTSIPSVLNERKKLFEIFNIFPGGVKHININRNCKEIANLVSQRDQLHFKLEQVITKWITMNVKESGKAAGGSYKMPPRPMHKTGFLGLLGKKVDSIEFYLANIIDLNKKICQMRENKDRFPIQESAFILFNTQLGAHAAAQSLVSNHAVHMEPRYIETDVEDIVWKNLDFSPFELMVRKNIGTIIAIAIAVLWFSPVAFVSSISKLEKLEEILPFIKDILPKSAAGRGFIQGLLPPIMLGILTALVPIIYTILSTFEGHPRTGDIQQSVMVKYFWFLIFTIVLASTLGGSFTAFFGNFEQIKNDSSFIFKTFADKLPPASDIFINFVLLKALSSSAQEILQIVNLFKRRLLVWLFVSSPRKHLQVIEMDPISWGTLWPEHTLIFVIGLLYSVMAPFSNLFITLYFFMFYTIYRYQMLYVYQTEKDQSLGMFFMQAVPQIFAGVYIFQITFAGMMLLQGVAGVAKLIVTLVLLVATIISHVFLNNKYAKIVNYIPITKSLAAERESALITQQVSEKPAVKMPEPGDYLTPTFAGEPMPSSDDHTSERSRLISYFTHPALSGPRPILWFPLDDSGFGATERSQISSRSGEFISVSNHGATMDSQGRIQLTMFSFPEDDNQTSIPQP